MCRKSQQYKLTWYLLKFCEDRKIIKCPIARNQIQKRTISLIDVSLIPIKV